MHFDFNWDAMRSHSSSQAPSALLSERLKALAEDSERRTQMGRFRDVYEDIERALAAGVRQADVIKELEACGLVMTLASFKSALQRVRQQRMPNIARSVTAASKSWLVAPREESFEFRPVTADDASDLV